MRKLRMGMVGGGRGAFIGGVHRMAAALDGQIDLVCGAFSSSAEKSKLSGQDLYLPSERTYGTYQEMIETEKSLPADIRMDFVSIVTPNHVHFGPAKMALENGFDVVCDKPVAFNLEEALELKKIVDSSDRIFALTHNYTGYPMVKQARAMIKAGELGTIRKIVVEYPQGWLSNKIEEADLKQASWKQASWRTDPARSGAAGCMGDIGTHAENLAEYITGLKITRLCADLTTFVNGRLLDDDGNVLVHYENGAKGIIYASQISVGEENGLRIRIYGTLAGIDWTQVEPNSLIVKYQDKPRQTIRTAVGNLHPEAQAHTRIPAGHPEGFLEAFANIYRNFAFCLQARLAGKAVDPIYRDFPGIDDGVRGMQFIDRVVQSSQKGAIWVDF